VPAAPRSARLRPRADVQTSAAAVAVESRAQQEASRERQRERRRRPHDRAAGRHPSGPAAADDELRRDDGREESRESRSAWAGTETVRAWRYLRIKVSSLTQKEVSMARNRAAPKGARFVRTYADLERYFADFGAGVYPFMWVIGPPGAGKSEEITEAMRGRQVYYRKGGQITPFQLYCDAYRHRGLPLSLDDAEHVLDDPPGKRLLCALADTTRARQVSWSSSTARLGEVPQSYETTSPLCIIANVTTSHAAIQSRAVTLFFDPSNVEIHCYVARWYWDQQIHNWFGQHLRRLPSLEARSYVHASQ